MNSTKRKINKGLIVLNKGERIAVISLLSLIVIFLGFSIFRPMVNPSKKDMMSVHKLDSLLAVHEAAQKQHKPMPNTEVPVAKQLRHTTETSERRSEKKPQHQKRGGYRQESPAHAQTSTFEHRKTVLSSIDLNQADSTALLELPQIGTTMASRIHRYRDRLGGFVTLEQLFEIKGMDTTRFEVIKPYITINVQDLHKININQDDFKTLLRHPYLEYEQVKVIVNHRERRGMIKNWEQLKGIVSEVNPLLEPYIDY